MAYVEHSKLDLSYPDTTKIWRYMRFERFADLIHEKALFFSSSKNFNDEFEGTFPKNMIKKLGLDKQVLPSDDGKHYSWVEWQKKERRSHLINCWHVNENECSAMWEKYGQDMPSSIAIQSNIDSLKSSFSETAEKVWIGEIKYTNFQKYEPSNRSFNVDVPNTLKTFFLKRCSFKDEHEIRAIIDKAYRKHLCIEKLRGGIFVDIDLKRLIECVYLSSLATPQDEESVRKMLAQYGYSFPIKKSDLGIPLYME